MLCLVLCLHLQLIVNFLLCFNAILALGSILCQNQTLNHNVESSYLRRNELRFTIRTLFTKRAYISYFDTMRSSNHPVIVLLPSLLTQSTCPNTSTGPCRFALTTFRSWYTICFFHVGNNFCFFDRPQLYGARNADKTSLACCLCLCRWWSSCSDGCDCNRFTRAAVPKTCGSRRVNSSTTAAPTHASRAP